MANDTKTVSGFLAAFDEQAQAVARNAGIHADSIYALTGSSESHRGSKVPAPSERGGLGNITTPAEFLNDLGRAAVEAEQGQMLGEMVDGAYQALAYGLTRQAITLDQAQAACRELGIPEVSTQAAFQGALRVGVFFTSADGVDVSGLGDEAKAAVTEALSALVSSKGLTPGEFEGYAQISGYPSVTVVVPEH